MTTEQTKPAAGECIVAVHKAALPMAKDESVGEFTQALSDAARAFVLGQKRIDTTKDGYAYTMEVYSGSCIVYYSSYNSSGARSVFGYVSLQYTRDADTKMFTFSDMTEVERVTTYRAKSQMKITKSAEGADVSAEVFEPGQGVHGWPVKKSLFAGVV